MNGWNTGEFRILQRESRNVRTMPVVGIFDPNRVLGVHKADVSDATEAWSVTHMESGMAIQTGFKRKVDALRFACEALARITDWTVRFTIEGPRVSKEMDQVIPNLRTKYEDAIIRTGHRRKQHVRR